MQIFWNLQLENFCSNNFEILLQILTEATVYAPSKVSFYKEQPIFTMAARDSHTCRINNENSIENSDFSLLYVHALCETIHTV